MDSGYTGADTGVWVSYIYNWYMHSGYTLYPGIPHPHPPTPLLVPVLGFPGTSVLPTGSNFHEGQHPDTLVY